MKNYHNFQYMQQRKELWFFGGCTFLVVVADFSKNIILYKIENDWYNCFETAVMTDEDDSIKAKNVTVCNSQVSLFPLFYSIWGLFDMFYLLVILFLKITEDYIANYSQAHDQKLVSIY